MAKKKENGDSKVAEPLRRDNSSCHRECKPRQTPIPPRLLHRLGGGARWSDILNHAVYIIIVLVQKGVVITPPVEFGKVFLRGMPCAGPTPPVELGKLIPPPRTANYSAGKTGARHCSLHAGYSSSRTSIEDGTKLSSR